MKHLGTFAGLGAAWIGILREIANEGRKVEYTDNAGESAGAREVIGLVAEVRGISLPDSVIERYKRPQEYEWMEKNFTQPGKVPELYDEPSYASRLHQYMDQKDQMGWLKERLEKNPHTRAATVTMFEPLRDEKYIPCVSLLDFQMEDGKLDLYVYCRALDFGSKAYANMVMLYRLLQEGAQHLHVPEGKMVFMIKSAHYYDRDEERVQKILAEQMRE